MPKYLQVVFSKDEKKELARLAVELETNMTAIVRQAVREFLIKHGGIAVMHRDNIAHDFAD